MKALENKTVDSRREIDILEGLDDIRMRNDMHNQVAETLLPFDQILVDGGTLEDYHDDDGSDDELVQLERQDELKALEAFKRKRVGERTESI